MQQIKKGINPLQIPTEKQLKKKRVCLWDDTNYVVRKKSRNEMANTVSLFLRRRRGRGVVSDKGSWLCKPVGGDNQRGGPRRAWEDAKGDRRPNSRETLNGPVRPGRARICKWFVYRLASSMTKDRVTSECADNLHTRPLQLRLRRQRQVIVNDALGEMD